MRHLSDFIIGLYSDWASLLSGIASIVLTFLGVFRNANLPPSAYFIAAAVCFVIACYRVWLKEHLRAIKAEGEPIPDHIWKEVCDKITTLSESERYLLDRFSFGQKMTSEQAAQYAAGGPSHIAMNIHTKTGFIDRPDKVWEINPVFQRAIRKYFSDQVKI
jgi:hypothetical protein